MVSNIEVMVLFYLLHEKKLLLCFRQTGKAAHSLNSSILEWYEKLGPPLREACSVTVQLTRAAYKLKVDIEFCKIDSYFEFIQKIIYLNILYSISLPSQKLWAWNMCFSQLEKIFDFQYFFISYYLLYLKFKKHITFLVKT